MSLSWTFLTKSFLPLRYRDVVATTAIGFWFANKYINYNSDRSDAEFIMSRMYTHDESDIEFREPTNMTDGAVRRTKLIEFANKIKADRAKKEREMMLDAYNYLNNKNHKPLG